jgi:hypothetical protein
VKIKAVSFYGKRYDLSYSALKLYFRKIVKYIFMRSIYWRRQIRFCPPLLLCERRAFFNLPFAVIGEGVFFTKTTVSF